MFYEETSVKNLSLCGVFEENLNDPRVLPCDRFVCFNCIDSLLDSDKKGIKCRDCGKLHEVSVEDFAKNERLIQFSQLKSNEISRGSKFSELKKLKNYINEISETIKLNLDFSVDKKIRKHCDEVRLGIEKAHLELDNVLNELLGKISSYEKNCVNEHMKQDRNQVENLLATSNEFEKEYDDLIKQPLVDETKLDAFQLKADFLLDDLRKGNDKIESNMFKNKQLNFEANKISSKVVGKLELRDYKLFYLNNDFFF